jgi:outer membrane protein assembly factor BamB
VANGVVYVGSFDGKVYAFDASNGQQLWSGATGGPIDSSPTVANGVVYIGSSDYNVYAFGLPAADAPVRPDPTTLKPNLTPSLQ